MGKKSKNTIAWVNKQYLKEYRKNFPDARIPCRDCAFRKNSDEYKDYSILSIMEQAKKGALFYCHDGMPLDPETGKYNPDVDPATLEPDPDLYKLCAGWAFYQYVLSKEEQAGVEK